MPRLVTVPPRPDFAGLTLDRPRIMGVLNVTPDSFSDGGKFLAPEAALTRAQAMLAAGADIIDVGGESTRPGAAPVGLDEEKRRVIPVIRALAERGVRVSVDTRHTEVMAEAVAAGARIVNDVSALADDGAVTLIAQSKVAVILMHMQGTPSTMQQNPTYVSAPKEIFDFLKGRVAACVAAGIGPARIAVDPGLGFGKTDDHNAQIFQDLATFHDMGCALAVGASRKAFIGRMSRGEGPEARLSGSLAAAVMAAERGAHILRVHDVAETAQALAVWARLSGS